tara:strand:+ start:2470 stop:2670 length:201 start_codon:yes stop_codon:yes gene_type:complete
MKVGDLVKVEGGKLRPEWYGMVGVVTSLEHEWAYQVSGHVWYEIGFPAYGIKTIRDDMLVVLNESR